MSICRNSCDLASVSMLSIQISYRNSLDLTVKLDSDRQTSIKIYTPVPKRRDPRGDILS